VPDVNNRMCCEISKLVKLKHKREALIYQRLRSSGILGGIGWQLVTDVSGHPTSVTNCQPTPRNVPVEQTLTDTPRRKPLSLALIQ
jgi:hypothetical protein